jgi:hypothetical protein
MEGLEEWLPPIFWARTTASKRPVRFHEVGTETGLQVAQALIEILFRLGQVFGRG